MNIWAVGDLHLSFDTPGKEMSLFGPQWERHHEKIAHFWDDHVQSHDLVLIPGDISWAMRLDGARKDLEWIDKRPGTKVMIRGNHDYWWESASKVRKSLPPSLHIISNDAFTFNDVSIAGARLWDCPAYSFSQFSTNADIAARIPTEKQSEEDDKIFQRELHRLEISLQALDPQAHLKIAMTHYPPIGADLAESAVSQLFEKAGVQIALFGHLHSLKPESVLFGTARGVQYHLVACDWINFTLQKIR